MVMDGKRAEIALNAMQSYRTRIDPVRQKDLEKRIKDKKAAADAFVLHNQKLIYAVASKQCAGKPQLYNDAVQDGNIGLLKAVDNFNPFLGFCFSTYATMWILQSIQSGMFEMASTFTAPSDINHLAGKLRAFSAKNSQTHQGKTAPASYLATAFHISEEKVNMLMGVISTPTSLDQHIGSQDDDGDGSTLNDLIPSDDSTPENLVVDQSMRQELWSLVHSVLEERERDVLFLRNGIKDGNKLTHEEIGQRLGISREGARQIEKTAIAKLSQNKKLRRIRDQMQQSETF